MGDRRSQSERELAEIRKELRTLRLLLESALVSDPQRGVGSERQALSVVERNKRDA